MPIGRLVDRMQAPVPDATVRIPCAPALEFGVEYRSLASPLPAVWEQDPGYVFVDEGVTIHVWDAATGEELLRFDCFDDDPHYHYRVPDSGQYLVVPYDVDANGDDMLEWALATLRRRLGPMLERAGAVAAAAGLDGKDVATALDEVEATARRAPTAAERDDLVATVGRFAREVVAPRVREYDAAERLPLDILEQMAELGFYGGTVPVEWGGAGLDHVTYAAVIEEISRVDHTLGVLLSMPSALVGGGLLAFGTDAQREQWLRPLASGTMFGGAGVTEPQSGSDVAGMQTTYRRDGDGFVLDGSKIWISNLDIASFFVTFATFDRSLRHAGITAFIVPADTPGLTTVPFHDKLGFRPLCSGELVLDGVRLGPEHLLGAEGHGFAVAMAAVERGRLAVASRAVGLAQACLDDCIEYSRARVVFGSPIGEFQLIQQKLADMKVQIDAARLLVRACAEAMDRGERARVEASVAKLYASDVAQRVATEAVQIHGAYGVSHEHRVSRLYRDAKVFQIVEGTNEIHRVLIARELLRAATPA